MKDLLCERLHQDALKSLSDLDLALQSENIDFEEIVNLSADKIPSNMDTGDLLFSLMFGALGALISTNKDLSSLCTQVHDMASSSINNDSSKIERIIDTLFGHSSDIMDKVSTNVMGAAGKPKKGYLTRGATKLPNGLFSGNTPKLPHRLMWGHDVLSFKKDNPFKLLVGQYGFGKGILQAIKHLFADTFSRQGLPIPGHSFFDYLSTAGSANTPGDLGNKLYDIAKGMAKDCGLNTQGCSFNLVAFNEMFSIHIQDIGSQGLLWVLSIAYFKARRISNKIRKNQFRLLAYSVNFYMSAIFGALQNGGIPHINWVALSMVIKNFVQLYIASNKETRFLQEKTEQLIQANIILEDKVLKTGNTINRHAYLWDYMEEYNNEIHSSASLVDFFEEDN